MKSIALFLVTLLTTALVGAANADTTTAPAATTPAAPSATAPTTPPAASTAATPATTTPATGTKKELTPQQQKFSACSKDAKSKGLKGDDRKTYMSTCLKGDGSSTTTKPDSAAVAAKKAKRRGCSAQAKTQNLTGDDRKKFMTTCMKQP